MTTAAASHFTETIHRAQQRYRLPAGARQLVLVRHGSSIGRTVETIAIGELTVSDPVLSSDGEAQAHAVATRLREEPVSHVVVTPLRRTQQTAVPLAAALGLTPVVVADLREVHLGDWEHSFYDHAEAGHPLVGRMFAEETWEVIPGAERNAAFAERVRCGIMQVVASTAAETTSVIFSHAGTIGEICRQATGSRPFAFNGPENASVTRLVIDGHGEWKLRCFNDVSHLGYA